MQPRRSAAGGGCNDTSQRTGPPPGHPLSCRCLRQEPVVTCQVQVKASSNDQQLSWAVQRAVLGMAQLCLASGHHAAAARLQQLKPPSSTSTSNSNRPVVTARSWHPAQLVL
jgi:hypothetical protein